MSKCLLNGIVFKRADLGHVTEAASFHQSGKPADLIVNCTGLMASMLGGVEDKTVVPARGQVVVVRNEPGVMVGGSSFGPKKSDMTYMMTRAAGEFFLCKIHYNLIAHITNSRWRHGPWWLL